MVYSLANDVEHLLVDCHCASAVLRGTVSSECVPDSTAREAVSDSTEAERPTSEAEAPPAASRPNSRVLAVHDHHVWHLRLARLQSGRTRRVS